MPRRNRQEEISRAVREHLAIAESHTPDVFPLNVKSVAAVLGISRTTLYEYGLDKEINAAEQRQRDNASLNGKALERRAYLENIQQLRAELVEADTRNKKLVERLVLVEANAARLGIDPEELFKPIVKPVRSISRAGGVNPRPKRRY